jgi:hypothetical protein
MKPIQPLIAAFIILLTATANLLQAQNTVAFLKTPHPLTETRLSPISTPYAVVPFKEVKGKILVTASLEGEEGFLILDTGAPMMIVNQKVEATQAARGFSVSRDVAVTSTTVGQLKWGELELHSLEALAVDLSHLERSLNHPILGMLGYEMIRSLNIIIDFPAKQLLIGTSRDDMFWQSPPLFSLPFRMEQHVPVIEAVIGQQSLKFGIDTGTEHNLIDSRLTEGVLQDAFTATDVTYLQGLDQQLDLVPVGTIDTMSIDNRQLAEQLFLAASLEGLQSATELNIDGLLGYSFFKNYKFCIDFKYERIYFWPPPNTDVQLASRSTPVSHGFSRPRI